VTAITASLTRISLENYIEKIANEFKNSIILISGYQVQNYSPKHPHVHILRTLPDLNPFIEG
jgi:hypothetical protein